MLFFSQCGARCDPSSPASPAFPVRWCEHEYSYLLLAGHPLQVLKPGPLLRKVLVCPPPQVQTQFCRQSVHRLTLHFEAQGIRIVIEPICVIILQKASTSSSSFNTPSLSSN